MDMSEGTSNTPTTKQGLRPDILEDIDQYLAVGMPVYDAHGENVGHIKMYSLVAGYLMVKVDAIDNRILYIPFRLIRSIDAQRLYFTQGQDVLFHTYMQPPTIRTVTETRPTVGPQGSELRTHQIQVVESGYDYQQVPINEVEVNDLSKRLAVGMVVVDVDGKRLGDITQYDIPRSLLVVEKGMFKPRVLFVPFSAIQFVDASAYTVVLSLPSDVVLKEHAMMAADIQ